MSLFNRTMLKLRKHVYEKHITVRKMTLNS